jgi:dihydroxyacetone kinase-like predicted kinase
MIPKYSLEFVLHAKNSSPKIIRNTLAEFGSGLAVSECRQSTESCNYEVSITTEDPTLVFDLCSQLGRIRSIKVHQGHKP